MAFSFQQKFDQSKLDRSIAVSSKNAIVQARIDIKQEDDFNNHFLHGDTQGNLGINELFWYWLYEIQLEGSDSFIRPMLKSDLDDWKSSYENIMIASLAASGDSAPPKKDWWEIFKVQLPDERYINGFYPPNANGVPEKELNWGTDYFNDNGDTLIGDSSYGYSNKGDSDGMIFWLYALDSSAGSNPTKYPFLGDTKVSGYIYSLASDAENAAKTFLYGGIATPGTQRDATMLGKGLLGRRRANVEITTDYSVPNHRYKIGADETIDQSTFYADNLADTNGYLNTQDYQTNFETTLLKVCQYGDSSSTLATHLRSLSVELAKIEAGTNTLFNSPDIIAEVGDSTTWVDNVLDTLGRCIGVNGDSWGSGVGDSSLYGLYTFMNGAAGTEAGFEEALDLVKFLNNTLVSSVEGRYTALKNGTIMGSESVTEAGFTGARKWRSFWVKTRIAKPKSTLLSYNALATSVDDANLEVDNKNQQLQIILGDTTWDHYQYIPTPLILASFYDPKLDQDDGSLIVKKITTIFDGQQHASEYVILRKLYTTASNNSISNDKWGDTYYYDTITTLNPDTRFVETTYTDFGKVSYAGDSVQDYQELFLYKHQLFSSRDLYGDTVENIYLEEKYLLYGDTGAYPIGSGDTRYLNPRLKPWSGLGDSSEVTGFWRSGINFVEDPEDLTTSNWTNVNATDELTDMYFDRKRFTKIENSGASVGYVRETIDTTGFSTTTPSIQVIIQQGSGTGDKAILSFYDVDGATHRCQVRINWATQAADSITGTLIDEEWISSTIVRITLISTTLTIANEHWIGCYGSDDAVAGEYNYYTAVQIEDKTYPTPYMGDSREASSLGYTYNWGDSGAIETWIYPRFNWDHALNKWIFHDMIDGTNRSIGCLYDVSVDKFRFVSFNVSGSVSIVIDSGISDAGYTGDTAFESNTYLNQWHHLKTTWQFLGDSITYGDTKIFKLFYNGNYIGGDSTGDSISFNDNLQIGSLPLWTALSDYEFDGEITDFLIWDYADESTTHYDNGNPYFYPDPFPTDTNYLYRVQNIDKDNLVSGDVTKSLQSKLYDSDNPRSFTSISGDSVLSLGDSHDYKKNEYVVINGTSNSNGYYKLTRTEDTSLFITPTLGVDTLGTVYPCTAVVFIQE